MRTWRVSAEPVTYNAAQKFFETDIRISAPLYVAKYSISLANMYLIRHTYLV